MLGTQHATIRMQQRGIPEQVVRNIIAPGSTHKVHGGATAGFVSKKDLQRLARRLPKNQSKQLDPHKSVYVRFEFFDPFIGENLVRLDS